MGIKFVGLDTCQNFVDGQTAPRSGEIVAVECITCVDLCDLSPVCGSSLLLADLSLNGGWQGGCGCVTLLDEYQVKVCCLAILESLVKCNLFLMFLSIAEYVYADSFYYLYVHTPKPKVEL